MGLRIVSQEWAEEQYRMFPGELQLWISRYFEGDPSSVLAASEIPQDETLLRYRNLLARGPNVKFQGKRLKLDPCRITMLRMLMAFQGTTVPHAVLRAAVIARKQGRAPGKALAVHITNIRNELRVHGATDISIVGVWGRGYLLL